MNYIFTIALSLYFLTQPIPNPDLLGKWKLAKVETDHGVLYPKMDFFLTITQDALLYNKDVNGCSAKPVFTEKTIKYDSELCQRACCDGNEDPIGGMINYNGDYQVTDSTLVINNELGFIYLKKIYSDLE